MLRTTRGSARETAVERGRSLHPAPSGRPGVQVPNRRTALHLLVQRSCHEFMEDDEVVADAIRAVARDAMSYEDLIEWFRVRMDRPTDAQRHSADGRRP